MGRDTFTLTDAVRMGHVVRIRCQRCRRQHNYLPADLLHLLGEQACHGVHHRMRCERCRTGDHLRADFHIPTPEDRQTMVFRRIKAIRFVRHVVWEDG